MTAYALPGTCSGGKEPPASHFLLPGMQLCVTITMCVRKLHIHAEQIRAKAGKMDAPDLWLPCEITSTGRRGGRNGIVKDAPA